MNSSDGRLVEADFSIERIVSLESAAEVAVADLAEVDSTLIVVNERPLVESDHVPPHKNGKLASVIECMLFVSSEPLSVEDIAKKLDIEPERVLEAADRLDTELSSRSGLQLIHVAGGLQISTKPEYSDYCSMILQPAARKLSTAALETLAIVAYRQPCTVPEIEAVRGVSVGSLVRTLVERGLVAEAGRKPVPGRPILYTTTPEFLEYFGLDHISELPDIDMLAVEESKVTESAVPVEAEEAQTPENVE